MPILVAAAGAGGVFWILGVACAAPLAAWLSSGYIAGIERQTMKLKRNRAKIQRRAVSVTNLRSSNSSL